MAKDTLYISEKEFKKNIEFLKSNIEDYGIGGDLDLEHIDWVFNVEPRVYGKSGTGYVKSESVRNRVKGLTWTAEGGRVYKYEKEIVDWGMQLSFPNEEDEPSVHPDIDPAGGYGLESHI
jgi:hypothetical protein